jgi:hypothetical protein
MSRNDLDKQTLYTGVKQLIETNADHIHLPQQKLYTLFSVAFQYFLFQSTKDPGHYIIRIEDSYLAEKLVRKSKDMITRKIMQKIYLPRKFKYEKSQFYLDFFNFQSWGLTNDLPQDKIKGALIVKNTQSKPMSENMTEEELEEEEKMLKGIPEDLFLTSLTSICSKSITIAYDQDYAGLEKVKFDFIKEEDERLASGVKILEDVDFSNIDE